MQNIIHEPRPGPAAPVRPQRKRWPAIVAASAALALLALLAWGLASTQAREQHYELRPQAAAGQPPLPEFRLLANRVRLSAARDAICRAFPGAEVRIRDADSGAELTGRSPYACPAAVGS